jgi:hypothetical protein
LYQADRLANMENTVLRVEVALNETWTGSSYVKHNCRRAESSSVLRFQVLTSSMNMRVFWDIAPCSLGVERRFRGAYYLHHKRNDGGSTLLWNVGLFRDYTALYPRRLSSSTPHFIKKFLALHGSWRFFTVFKKVSHWILQIQFIPIDVLTYYCLHSL